MKTRTNLISIQKRIPPILSVDVFYEGKQWEFTYKYKLKDFSHSFLVKYVKSSSGCHFLNELRFTVFTIHYLFTRPIKLCTTLWNFTLEILEQPHKIPSSTIVKCEFFTLIKVLCVVFQIENLITCKCIHTLFTNLVCFW